MDVREKLVELLKSVLPNFRNNMAYWGEKPIYEFADCLIANGVTVQECGYWVSLTDCANAGVYCSVCHKRFTKKIMRGATEKINCVLTIARIVAQK